LWVVPRDSLALAIKEILRFSIDFPKPFPLVNIQGDPIAASLFHGYADPTLRAENASPNIYLACSWTHTLSAKPHPSQT
jgi:hypothetical protein